jgi:soluble lytic murein transglycosylase-like protein
MSVFKRITRLLLFGFPLLAGLLGYVVFSQQEGRYYASLYLSRVEYRPFLLESWKKQGPGRGLSLLGQKVPQPIWEQSQEVSRLLSAKSLGSNWTDKELRDLSLYIVMKANDYNLSPLFVLSLIEVESQFQNSAVSARGARGLMQLMPATAQGLAEEFGLHWKGEDSLNDPKVNIDLGLRYVQALRSKFDKPEYVLTAYNIGPGALEKKLKKGETLPTGYYRRVMKVMKGYHRASPQARPLTANSQWL